MVQGPPLVVGTLQGVTTPLSTPLMAKKLRTTSLEEALLNAAAAGKHKLDAVGELSKYSGRILVITAAIKEIVPFLNRRK